MEEKVKEAAYQAIADAFMIDVSEVERNPDRRLREDMGASSMQYFPLIAALEDKFDIELDFHGFQNEARTFAQVADYTYAVYLEQHQ